MSKLERFPIDGDIKEWMKSVYKRDTYKTTVVEGQRLRVPPPEAFVDWPPGPPGGPVPGVNCPAEPETEAADADAERNAE